MIAARMRCEHWVSSRTLEGDRPASCSLTKTPARDSRISARYASAVTAKPSGTRTPSGTSSRSSSPSEAFFPPTEPTSLRVTS